MAEKICDDSDHGFDCVSSIYLSKENDSIILEVEGRDPYAGNNTEHIYLSEKNVRRLIDRLNVYLTD